MDRERWNKRSGFVMAAIGSAIGLGNVWRFPYMAYENGGGAFFIPFIIALITTGIPLVALECYLGTRYQRGPTEVFGMIRKRTNYIGWLAVFTGGMILCYYSVVIAWAFNYMVHAVGVHWAGREEAFFFQDILGRTGGVGEFGGVAWHVVLGNLISWGVMYLIICKGVRRIEKVIHAFVILPWILLFILIVRGVTLPGAAGGLEFYLNPDFGCLAKPEVWMAAYGQVFFSISVGFGIMIAYSSYLNRDSDINANAWVISFADSITSFFAGFAVFSAIGYLSFTTGQPVDQVAGAGPGLAFVIYPASIAKLPGGMAVQSVFGVLFFLMLLAIGIDSGFSFLETIVTGMKDSFNLRRETLAFWVCVAGFLIGVVYASGPGLYWMDIVDHWMNWSLVLVALLEAVLIGWFFDIKKVSEDMDATSQIKFGRLWVASIKYLTPAVLFLIILSSVLDELQTPYMGYPVWAAMVAWLLFTAMILAAAYMQHRTEAPFSPDRRVRLTAWLIIYAGVNIGFFLAYTAASMVSPVIMILGSLILGGWLIISLNRLNLTATAKEAKK